MILQSKENSIGTNSIFKFKESLQDVIDKLAR